MNTLLEPLPGNLLLVIAPQAGGPLMLELLARLACRGPLRLLDAGNRFDVYRCHGAIARALNGQTAGLPAILGRIHLARAFTCYQVETLLKETPLQPVPTVVLDLLSTFYDESVPAGESLRILETCIFHLHRLNRLAPVAISVQGGLASPPAPGASPPASLPPSGGIEGGPLHSDRPELLQALQAAAGQTWILEPHVPPAPPRLL